MDTNHHDPTSNGQVNSETNEEIFNNDEKYSDKLTSNSSHVHKLLHGSSSASNAGIIYYKCLSEEMEKEISTLQNAIEEGESELITQKQNIKDMIYQKNKSLCDFHEQFRKFNQKIEYENKMEEDIEHLVQFLDELMPMNNEINYVKSSEINIRNYVIAKYQATCLELQPTKDAFENEVEQLQLKLNEFNEWKTEWETLDKLNLDINHAIELHQEKLNHLIWSIKNEVADYERLKNEVERIQMQTDSEILEKQQTLKNNAAQIQLAFNSVKAQFSECSGIQNKIIQNKQEFTKYNGMLFQKNEKLTEVETAIAEKKTKLEELQKKMEVNCVRLNELEGEKKLEIEKREKFGNILHEYRQKIANEETLLNNLVDEERSNEEKREQILAEIKTHRGKIDSFDETQNTFANEVARNKSLAKDISDLTQKNIATKKNLFQLNNELETEIKKINELKKSLLSRNISVDDDSSDKNLLHSYLTAENEQNAMSKLLDDELDALLDQIFEKRVDIDDLKQDLGKLSDQGLELEEEVIKKEKLLQQLTNSAKTYDSSVLALKQNVYAGKYVTVQDLNRQLTLLTNHVKNERNSVEKLKEEIEKLTELEEMGKKRRLLNPEKRQDPDSAAPPKVSRTVRPKKKVEEPKNINEKSISQHKDIYHFT